MSLRLVPLSWLMVAAAAVSPSAGHGAEPPADLVVTNAQVITMAPRAPRAMAVAIREGRFVAIGGEEEVRPWIGERTRVVDAGGRAVVPGLIESHVHATGAARGEVEAPFVQLGSIAEIQAWLRTRAAEAPADRWIRLPRVDVTRIRERRMPTPAELGEAAPRHPAVFTWQYANRQVLVLNAAALRASGITASTEPPPRGKIHLDDAGQPTGVLENCGALLAEQLKRVEVSEADYLDSLGRLLHHYNELGITSIYERNSGVQGVRDYQKLQAQDRLTARATVTIGLSTDGTVEGTEKSIRALPFQWNEGDDWVRVGPLKIGVDGGVLYGTAFLREPYGADAFSLYGISDPQYRGDLRVAPENLKNIIRTGHRLGWQMSSHVTGDAGVDAVLDAVEAAHGDSPIDGRRYTLIHAYFPHPDTAARAAKLGVCVDTQPAWFYKDGDALADALGGGRLSQFIGLRTWLDAGVRTAINADHMQGFGPDSSLNPYNPFLAMWTAITRRTEGGREFGVDQRVTREEALRLVTSDAAWLGFGEERVGTIEVGKLGDLAILTADPLTCAEAELPAIRAVMTIVGGRVVHEQQQLASAPPLLRADAIDTPICIEPNDETGDSRAVVVGDVPQVYTDQCLPLNATGRVTGSGAEQTRLVLDRVDQCLQTLGSQLSLAARLHICVANDELRAVVRQELAARFPGAHKPAVTYVVSKLPHDALVAIDAVGVVAQPQGQLPGQNGADEASFREVRFTTDTPFAPGSRSLAARLPVGARIFIAGQAEPSESLAEATRGTLDSLKRTLANMGRSELDIVQLKAFVQPMSEWETVRREVAAFYPGRQSPPLVLVEWRSSAKVPIEIEAVAWGGLARTGEIVEYSTPPGMTTSPVYSRVARTNQTRTLFISGLQAAASDADPLTAASGEREVREVFTELQRILRLAGSDLRHLVKATYYCASDSSSAQLNAIRPEFYDPTRPPSASKALVAGTGDSRLGLTIDMIAAPAPSDSFPEHGAAEQGHRLSPDDAAAGWLALFDGESTLGWRGARVESGALAGGETTLRIPDSELRAEVSSGGKIMVGDREFDVPAGAWRLDRTGRLSGPLRLGEGVRVTSLAIRPLDLRPLFNGQDLHGWTVREHPRATPERRTTWEVRDGAIHSQGGPGCLEYSAKTFGDFVLQTEIRTCRRLVNGGLFVRAIPGDFLNGYEAQIFHYCHDDPARPGRWSTGGIDDRVNSRRLVSRDEIAFQMTVIAQGARLATWVNGHQQVDWLDDRPAHENARQGSRTAPGALQLQSHDPDSDLEFRALRIRGLDQ